MSLVYVPVAMTTSIGVGMLRKFGVLRGFVVKDFI